MNLALSRIWRLCQEQMAHRIKPRNPTLQAETIVPRCAHDLEKNAFGGAGVDVDGLRGAVHAIVAIAAAPEFGQSLSRGSGVPLATAIVALGQLEALRAGERPVV